MKKMLINATLPGENRVAVVEDGVLTELDIEFAGHEQTRGNIYKAVVVRVEPGLQAAFVNYGPDKLGFLQIGEVHPSCYRREVSGRPRIEEVLERGQELVVQVEKEERGTKGAALTTYLNFPGRYSVMMFGNDTRGVSLKVEDAERKSLRKVLDSVPLPDQIGCIVRTAAVEREPEEIRQDIVYLLNVYRSILALSAEVKAPSKLYQESNLILRSLRDHFSTDIEEVLIDDPEVFREAKEFFNHVMPDYSRLVKLHQERRPIFSRYQIEEQIQQIHNAKVQLPSGGSIVIDQTEALTAIDVNSGRMNKEGRLEDTAFKTNLEAAAEVARQMRLRDLGGLVVIDFIDMIERKHNREVEHRLRDALKRDRARISIGHISQFGLLEMSRQRIATAIVDSSLVVCSHCEGKGRVKSVESRSADVLRSIHTEIGRGRIATVEVRTSLEVATHLLNSRRRELFSLEEKYDVSVRVLGDSTMTIKDLEVTSTRRSEEQERATRQAAAGTVTLFGEATFTIDPTTLPELPEGDGTVNSSRRKRRGRGRGEAASAGKKGEAAALEADGGSPEAAEAGQDDLAVAETATAMQAEVAETENVPPVEGDETDHTDEGGEEGGGRKRRRRRRRRRGKKPGDGAEAGAEEDADSDDPAEDAEPTLSADAETLPAGGEEPALEESDELEGDEAAAPKKKRRRRGRRGGSKGSRESSAADAADASQQGGSEPAAPEVAPAEMQPVSQPEAAQTPGDEPAKKKATRSRKSAPKEKPDADTPADTPQPVAEAPVEAGASAEVPVAKAAKPPARKRSVKKKEEAGEADQPVAEETIEKPKKPAAKKAPAKKPVAKETGSIETAEEPKPKKATPRKKVAAATGEEPAAEAKPKRTTKAAKSAAAAEPAAEEPKPKRATRAKKTGADGEAGEEKPAKPKRTPRKKAEPEAE